MCRNSATCAGEKSTQVPPDVTGADFGWKNFHLFSTIGVELVDVVS